MPYTIGPLTRTEFTTAVDLAAAEGWNPGLHDADAFYPTDPEGFLGGFLDGEPVAYVSAVRYGESFGFIGFYIVLPEYRGKGYGMEIFRAALDRLEGRIIGADGVFERLSDYESIGFRLAYRNIRFAYEVTGREKGSLTTYQLLADVPFNDLVAYDTLCFPTERTTFLKRWTELPDSYGVAVVEEGAIRGYGMIRACREGYKIGPIFADDAAIAEGIFLQLCTFAGAGETIYFDIPEINGPAMGIAEKYGMREAFGTGRIYMNGEPEVELAKVFGVTSFELG